MSIPLLSTEEGDLSSSAQCEIKEETSTVTSGLVYEHTHIKPLAIQKLYSRTTLLVLEEEDYIEGIWAIMTWVESWLGYSFIVQFYPATHEQLTFTDKL